MALSLVPPPLRAAYPYTPFQGCLPLHSILRVDCPYTLFDGSLTLTLYSKGRLPLHSIQRVAYPYTLFQGSHTLGRSPYALFQGSLILTLYSKGRSPLHSSACPHTLLRGHLPLLWSTGPLSMPFPFALFSLLGRLPPPGHTCPCTLRGRPSSWSALPMLWTLVSYYYLFILFIIIIIYFYYYYTSIYIYIYIYIGPCSYAFLPSTHTKKFFCEQKKYIYIFFCCSTFAARYAFHDLLASHSVFPSTSPTYLLTLLG